MTKIKCIKTYDLSNDPKFPGVYCRGLNNFGGEFMVRTLVIDGDTVMLPVPKGHLWEYVTGESK